MRRADAGYGGASGPRRRDFNRLTNMVDHVGTTRYSYDAAGLLASEDGPWADDTVSYSYQYRLRTGLSLAQPGGSPWSQGYSHDAARRLQTLTSPAGSFGYEYATVGTRSTASLISKLTLPNGAYITNTFDPVARLTGTYLKNSAASILNAHEYAVNLAGQRTRQTRTQDDFVDYGYDNAGQLLGALGQESSGTNRLNERLRYVYDAAGNLNWRTNDALVQQLSVNNLNELTTIGRSGTLTVAGTATEPKATQNQPGVTNVLVSGTGLGSGSAELYGDGSWARAGAVPADGDNTYTAVGRDTYGRVDTNTITASLPTSLSFVYDLNGNLRTNGTQILDYDDENQLITNWVAATWKTEFVYDGQHRRRVQRDYAWSGSSWALTNEVHLVYGGKVILQQRGANNLPTLTFTRGLDLSGTFQGAGGIGSLLAMTDSSLFALGASRSTHSYYHADGGGNVTCLINTSQFLVARAIYDPYGSFLSLSGPAASVNPFWYSSKPLHRLSGNCDFLYRWYSPELQRWLTRDRIAELGGINLYAYVQNDPVNATDPEGYGTITIVSRTGQVTIENTPNVTPGWRPPPRTPSAATADDSIDCWPSSPLDMVPGQGLGRSITALAKYEECIEECGRRFKICGGDPNKWEACTRLCEIRRDQYLVGARSTGRDLRPRAVVFDPPQAWWIRALNWIPDRIRNLWR